MEKLELHTPDFIDENIAKLAELFPSCVTEARDEQGRLTKAIDFDQLRQELSDHYRGRTARAVPPRLGRANARRCSPPMRRSPRRFDLAAKRASTSTPRRTCSSKATTLMR